MFEEIDREASETPIVVDRVNSLVELGCWCLRLFAGGADLDCSSKVASSSSSSLRLVPARDLGLKLVSIFRFGMTSRKDMLQVFVSFYTVTHILGSELSSVIYVRTLSFD